MTKPIQIRNEEVAQDIRDLASLTGKPITEAVGQVVRSRLAQLRHGDDIEQRRQRIRTTVAAFAALPKTGPDITDDDLYDDDGLPK